jgi:hypothetical protein
VLVISDVFRACDRQQSQQRSNRRIKMAKTILIERHSIEDIKSTMNALSQCPMDSTVLMWGEATRGGFAFGGILYLLFFAGALVAVSDSEYQVSLEVAQRADKMFGVFCEDKRQQISGKQFLTAWRKR